MFYRLSFLVLLILSSATLAADDKADPIKTAPSKVTAVTVYSDTALVTREVTAPEGAGLMELVVSPLPPYTMQSSLYAEGGENVRVLSVRFRTRAIAEDTRDEVRKLETQIKTLSTKQQTLEADMKSSTENLKLLDKLEGFTARSLDHLTEKGQLDTEKIIALAKFVQEDRTKRTKEQLVIKQGLEDIQAQIAFAKRLLEERSAGSVQTERDAVILVDKKAGAATVRLNYLVSSASWRPQYKFRASGNNKDPITVEYQAAIEQKTGEDWVNAQVTLSTARPLLNASPPDLRTLAIAVGPPGTGVAVLPNAPAPGSPPAALKKDLEKLSKDLRGQAAGNYAMKNAEEAAKQTNDAAAIEQYCDLFISHDELVRADRAAANDTPSVTYTLKNRITLPTRNDEQVVEITRLDMAGRFYYKAVPVLTPNVYRLAELVNTGEIVLLPGEATMYLAGDFVGSTRLPLVAAGKPFTVGFGADPQLQATRVLEDKTRTTQGGNQVLTFKYRIMISSYKSVAVPVQVWDRMPYAETAMTIAVNLVGPKPSLSTDPLYLRDEKGKGLLRWDVTLEPKQNGEKAMTIDYEFKMELDKNVNIGAFQAK